MATSISRNNNFDLIRILAALQVVYSHSLRHIQPDSEFLEKAYYLFIRYFQGVPIFFCVSGFLIFWSFSRNSSDLTQFFKNRGLRLFPALWACLLVTIILLLVDFPSLSLLKENVKILILWVIGQMTIIHFYTPDVLRFWGEGTPNGSLWTITVEIQFYLMTPVIYFLSKLKRGKVLSIVLLVFLSMLINYFGDAFLTRDSILFKLLAVSILPYLYYFMIGVLAFIYWEYIRKFLEGKFIYWAIGYIAYFVVFGNILGYEISNYWIQSPMNLISDILVCGLTFSFAFTMGNLSEKILKGNDISYGVYIYHMIVINWLVHHGFRNYLMSFWLTFVITIFLALLSWLFIEKMALKYKKRSNLK